MGNKCEKCRKIFDNCRNGCIFVRGKNKKIQRFETKSERNGRTYCVIRLPKYIL